MSGLFLPWSSCCPHILGHEKMLQKLSSRLTSTPPSTSVQQLYWQVLICYPQQIYNHIYKSGVSDRVRKGSLHQIHLLKSLVSFLLLSFHKKDDFRRDMLAIVVCNLWMSKGNNNNRHLRIRDGQQTKWVVTILIGSRSIAKFQIPNSASL